MSEIMNNVKTVNSVVRTLMLLGVTGAVGYGGWFGYENYVRPGFEAKRAIADLESMKAEFAAQSEEMKKISAVNERLETSLKLLKVDRRIANVKVMEKGTDDEGQPFIEVRFTEINEYGDIVGSPRCASGSHLTYHRTGETFAAGTAPKKPTTPSNVINDQTLAEKKAAEAPK